MGQAKAKRFFDADEAEPIAFSDLPHLIAMALHPEATDDLVKALHEQAQKEQLARAVALHQLKVRNPIHMGEHEFPQGAALDTAVVLPHDLAPYLQERGIALRLSSGALDTASGDEQDSEGREAASSPVKAGDSVGGPKQPQFSMTRAALVQAHRHEWPTIDADLKDASKNGLSKAKAAVRDWNEALALEWARAHAKLVLQAPGSAADLTDAMRNLATLPSRKNHLKG